MNILFIDPGVKEKARTYPYYLGLPNALGRLIQSSGGKFYIYSNKFRSITECIKGCSFLPDVIIFGLGWFSSKVFGKLEELSVLNIPVICQIFKHELDLEEKLNFCRINNVNAILTSVPYTEYYQEKTGIPAYLIKHGADPDIFNLHKTERVYDFGFSGALHDSKLYAKGAYKTQDLRRRIQDLVSSKKDLKCFLNGSDSITPRIENQMDYAKCISKSKIWLSTTCSFLDVPPRYYELALSGTLIFTNPLHEMYQSTFRDGDNCIYFSEDLSDFLDKLYYYLEHEEERNRITWIAYNETILFHTWNCRAKEVISIIQEMGWNQKQKNILNQ